LISAALACAGAMVCGLTFASVPAAAQSGFAFSHSFGHYDSYLLVGVAVDNSQGLSKGDVYVTELATNTLDKFNATGSELLTQTSVPGGGYQLTVNPYPGLAEGDVYVAGVRNGVVYTFSPGLRILKEVTGFSAPSGVAVDEAGDIFVSELGSGSVREFNAAWEPIDASGALDSDNTVAEGLSGPQTLAVDRTGTHMYVATGAGTIMYTLVGGAYVASAEPLDPAASNGVVVAPAGNVYVDQSEELAEYEPTGGAPLTTFGSGLLIEGSIGVGVSGETGNVYVAYSHGNVVDVFEPGLIPEAPVTEAAEAHGTAVVLRGELSPHGAAGKVTYRFTYNTGGTCTGGQSTGSVEVAEGKQTLVETEVTGLKPNTQYTYCLTASDAFGGPVEGNGVSFQTGALAFGVNDEYYSAVGSNGAVVQGQINPGSNPIQSYYFEYGTSTAYGSTTAAQSLPGVAESVNVSAQLGGLAEGTEYHFRLVATSTGSETTYGGDVAFRTLSTGVQGLPDGREYELVSPVADNEADVFVPEVFTPGSQLLGAEGIQTRLPFQVAADGDAVAYVGEASGGGGNGRDGEGSGNEYLATRSPAGAWSQADIQPAGVASAHYQAFSSDLSIGILEKAENGSGETHGPLYVRSSATGTDTELSPAGDAVYAGSSANGSYLLMDASGLYDSVQGQVSAVNVLPDGAPEADATFGAPALRDREANPPDLSDVISTDGARVFWSGLSSGGLYVRENPGQPQSPLNGQGECTVPADACTLQVDAAAAGAKGKSGGGRFWMADSEGSKVFFTDESQLTSNSTAAPGAPDLYEYQINGATGSTLTDLTVHAGEPAAVRGVLGGSEDGSYVYFVAGGVLAGAAKPQNCEPEPAPGLPTGGCNLYVLHGGDVSFIATLSSQDGIRAMPAAGDGDGSGEFGDWQPGLGHRTAEVTPNGQSLVFMSNESLTGYDNTARGSREPVDEVYVYQADAGGRLSCASCNPGGEPPSVNGYGAAAFLPVSWSDTQLPRWVSEEGSRVFFDSAEPLVPRDSNGRQDVYEWERDGTGSCQSGAGCVYLISEGLNSYASWLLGASANGNDVFIITRSELLQDGQSETYAVYDARVGGAQPVAAAGCPATGCQGVPVAPPVFATPPSSTFNGVGNFSSPTPTTVKSKPAVKALTRAQKRARALRACAHKRGRARRTCEAAARRRYKVKAKRTSSKKPAKGRG
jgi:hypothetical protein